VNSDCSRDTNSRVKKDDKSSTQSWALVMTKDDYFIHARELDEFESINV
jgi:hypothetical protein